MSQQTSTESIHQPAFFERPVKGLRLSPANMRKGYKPSDDPQFDSLVASIRSIGLINPITLDEKERIVAGQRRFHAIKSLIKEGHYPSDLNVPCRGSTGSAEKDHVVSLAENCTRLDTNALVQAEAFTKLVQEGMDIEEVAATFCVEAHYVKQRMVLSQLCDEAKEAFREGEVNLGELYTLTLCDHDQQRLAIDTGRTSHYWVRQLIQQGDSEPVLASHALFDLAESSVPVTEDLFGKSEGVELVVLDADAFWKEQHASIDEQIKKLESNGWTVIKQEVGEYFSEWYYEKATKADGGAVYVQIDTNGRVQFHKGYRAPEAHTEDEVTDVLKEKPVTELTKAQAKNISVWQSVMVRHALIDEPEFGHRLLLAFMLSRHVGVGFTVDRSESSPALLDPESAVAQSKINQAVTDHLEQLISEYRIPRAAMYGDDAGLWCLFEHLQGLSQEAIIALFNGILLVALPHDPVLLQLLGSRLSIDAAPLFECDTTFIEAMRNRSAIEEILRENGLNPNDFKTVKAMKLKLIEAAEKGDFITPKWLSFPREQYVSENTLDGVQAYNKVMTEIGEFDPEDESEYSWRQPLY